MKKLKSQKKLTLDTFLDNLCKLAKKGGRAPIQQVALIDIINIIKETLGEDCSQQNISSVMENLVLRVETALCAYELPLDRKVDLATGTVIDGRPVQEREMSISFKLLGTLIVFGWATNLPGIQLVYQQNDKIFFVIKEPVRNQ